MEWNRDFQGETSRRGSLTLSWADKGPEGPARTVRPGRGLGGARSLPPPGPNFPATPSLAPRASLPHGPSPATAARPKPWVPPSPSNLSDPVPRPALRPPGKPGRAGTGRAALRPRHCRRAPSARAKFAWLGAEASPGAEVGAQVPHTLPGEREQSSPPAPLTSRRSSQPAALARSLAGSAELRDLGGGAGRRGGAALASQRQN